MYNVVYEGTVHLVESLDETGDIKSVITDVCYDGNAAGLAVFLFSEILDFMRVSKLNAMRVYLGEISTYFYFSKIKDEIMEDEMTFYIAISQALQDYIKVFQSKETLSYGMYEKQKESLMRVDEIFLKTIINLGGLFDYV